MFNYYKKIRTNVTESNIMLYGDFNIGHEKLSTFIGYKKNDNKMPISLTMKNERKVYYLQLRKNNYLTHKIFKLYFLDITIQSRSNFHSIYFI